ncbi:MAG: caspase family protein [Nitrospira sp.]
MAVILVSSGCQYFSPRHVSTSYNLPLKVLLRLDPSIGGAALDYHDACARAVSLPVHELLAAELKKRMAQVFEGVVVQAEPSSEAIDGVLDVALGLRRVDMFVVRKANKSYPATVTIGLDVAYTDLQGTVLHSKKLQSVTTGEVDARAETCDITGLDKVAKEVIATVVEGVAKQLGTSTKIREQAQFRKTQRGTTAQAGSVAQVPPSSLTVAPLSNAPVASAPPLATEGAPPAPAATNGTTQLSFRTILRDQNQNQVLEQNERFSVDFEVKNEGTTTADAVAVDLSGHPALVASVKTPVSVGLLQPGEIRRVTVEGIVGKVPESEQAELICTLQAAANVALPSAKKFFVAIRPDEADATEVVSVDVDQLPSRKGKLVQPHAVAIAIGVGAFRDPAMPTMKLAAHDAEIMSGYFTSLMGIPPQKVKVVLDAKGLKDDWIDVFEQWLPKQGGPHTMAYVYIAGRGLVDPETGAVSLLPYDATLSGTARAFSLARLQRALTNAPVKQAVVMLDLSLEPLSGSDPARVAQPRWISPESNGDQERVMLMVGNATVQEAQAYQPGQHGLFTYFLLKGLRGAADLDKNGSVLAGELCAYVQRQVTAVGRSISGDTQQPLCLPDANGASPLRQLRLSKLP